MSQVGQVTYGDTDVLRRRADQLREQAVDIRAIADQLVSRTESIGWSGRAAESMRVRVADRAAQLRAAASGHETAADTLDRHLLEVDRVTDAIASIERRAGRLVADARSRVATARAAADAAGTTGVRVTPDPDDEVLAAFDPPPSGHLDWLTVELPGL